MKNLFILMFFILGFSWVQADDYSSAPERGILIIITTDKANIKSTEGVKFSGSIKVVNKDKDDDDNKDHKTEKTKTLLQAFQKDGLDIVGTFPSEAIDITNNLELTSTSENEIKFSFTASNVNTNDLNQFSVKVYNNHKNKELLSRLAQIKAKLERRILSLNELKYRSKKDNWSAAAIEYINKKTEYLNQLSIQINQNINANENLLAENRYALQVDNAIASSSQISTIMNKYRFIITSEVGTVIEGLGTKIKGVITNLQHSGENGEDREDEDKLSIADFIFNDKYVFTSPVQKIKDGQSISFDYETAGLSPVNKNIFTVVLYKAKKNKREDRIGYLSQIVPVVSDHAAPVWLSDSLPTNLADTLYLQALSFINLNVSDALGRIDENSFTVKLVGSLANGSIYNQDVTSKISRIKIGDGSSYNFIGDLNPLGEGEYSFEAAVKDLAKNMATPNPYKINFKIDRTKPTIAINLHEPILTNKINFEVPVVISDLSDTNTEVYINNSLAFSTVLKQFTAVVVLNIEGNNIIRVVSTDSAGNVSDIKQMTINRDNTPPVLSNLQPINNSTIANMRFGVSGSSNEPLSVITVNGVALSLSVDKMSFSGQYISSTQGENELVIVAKDLLGNFTTANIRINLSDRLLAKELVTIIPDADKRHYVVIGKTGAARAGAEVSISAGLLSLNRGSDIASLSGTFSVRLDKFTKVTVKAKDLETNEEDSFELNFNVPTQIAGIIKDTDDAPLFGATVRILGTSIAVVSDASGIFSIQNAPIGDQILSVDGSTIEQPTTESQRRFSVYNMAISVSAGQVNTFPRPIYLTATLLDGTGTTVANNAAASVTDSNAPGVQISIPVNGAVFPDGSNAGHISMKNIPADKTLIPIPSNIVPDEVIALEPSGLRFKNPVEVIIPNVNELNEGAEVFILSLNSKSGQWEIDGAGKVEAGGQTIKTKPGKGITHFSLIFALPTSPIIENVQDPNLQGISTTKGAMETSVVLPSYKSLGQKITPSLRYNSSWANPEAFVSNIFDVPKYEIKFNQTAQNNSSETVQGPEQCVYLLGIKLYCNTPAYLVEVYHNEGLLTEAGYFVDELSAQSWIGINSTDNETFETVNSSQNSNDLTGAVLKNTIKTDKWTIKNNETGTAIPNLSQMSFGIPLIKDDGTYLRSGIYPSFTRFQLKLKHLTFTTEYANQSLYINHKIVNDDKYTFSREWKDLKTHYLDSIMPKDITRDILVQNKVNSPVGRGWNFSPAQKLINTKGSKILLEDADGEISTYTVSYPIETVFNANGTDIDLTKGAGLSTWPKIYASTFGADKIGRMVQVDLENGNQISNVSQLESIAGSTGFDKIDECKPGAYNPFIRKYKFNFRHKPAISNVVQFPDGRLIASNSTTHSIIDITNPTSYTLGGDRNGAPFNLNVASAGHEQRYLALCESLNLDCDPLINLNSTQACNSILEHHDESGELAQAGESAPIAPIGSNDFSNGLVNASGNFGTENFRDVRFNSPSGLVISPDGKLVVADSGSNVVYKINTTTGKLSILAGDYGATDRGDGSFAAPQVIFDVVKIDSLKELFISEMLPKAFAVAGTGLSSYAQSSIYHPKGLAYDSNGNLYITSENGFVRKVDTNGIISTFAGKRLQDGGVFATDIHAELMIFNNPTGVIVDSDKNMMYVADTGNNRIVQIDMQSKIANTIAGNGSCDTDLKDGGSSLNASFCSPTWLGFDNEKNLLVLDSGHQRVRRIRLNKESSPNLTYLPSNKDLSTLEKHSDGTFLRKFRDGSQSFFNVKGQELSSVDRVGRTVSYTYDANTDNLIRVSDATGQISEFVYSGDKLQYFQDPAGRTTYFIYEGNNSEFLTSIVFPDKSSKKFSYDLAGRMLSEENERNLKRHYEYNAVGRLASVTDENNILTYVNDKVSQTLNSPKREGLGAGKANSSVTLPNDTEIKMTNDTNGFIRKIRDPMGRDTELISDFEGNVLEIKRGVDEHVSMKYDSNTRDLLETKNEITGQKNSSTFNQFGQELSKTDFKTNVISRNYAATTGLLLNEDHPNDVKVDYSYNTHGLPIKKTVYPDGNISNGLSTQFEYDGFGNPTKIISPDGKYIVNTYDRAGNVITSKAFKDSTTSFTTIYEYYEGNNRLKKVFSPKNEVTEYKYLDTGELSEIIDPKQKSTYFKYDKKGQLLTKITPEQFSYQFEYDTVGNLKKETDPNGSVKEYLYWSNNKIKTVRMADETISYEYDSKDQIKSIYTDSGIGNDINYTRDINNRIIIENSGGRFTNTMTYDDNGNRTSMYTSSSGFLAALTLPGSLTYLQKIDYNYDANNRLISMSNYWGDQFDFNFDRANRLTSMIRPGSKTDYIYNTGSSLAQIIHSANNITKAFVEFSYDNRNFVTKKRLPASTFNYKYDNNGQLVESNKVENPAENENFSYDELGNRTAGIYDQSDQRIQDDGSYIYLYDNNGNILSKSSKAQGVSYAFEYNSRNQMKKAYVLASPLTAPIKTISYKYDAIGRRHQKSVIDQLDSSKSFTRKYIYDGQNIVAEIDGENRLLASYTHSPLSPDDLLAVHFTNHAVQNANGGDALSDEYVLSQAQGNFYYLKDHLNTVTDIINGQGNIVQSYNYSSFGVLRGITDSNGADLNFKSAPIRTHFTFTSREHEQETGLYYYRARYYDPSLGRFLQQDPEPGKLANPSTFLSKYIYGANNPVMYSDPSGRFFFLSMFLGSFLLESSLAATLIAGATAALAAVELSKYHGNTAEMLNKENPWSLLGAAVSGAFFSWAGGAMTSSLLNSSGGLAMSQTVGIGVTRFSAGFVSNGFASVGMTAVFDATNILNISSKDYANALIFGGLVGGTVEFSNWLFYSHVAVPLAISSNGTVSIVIDYVPAKKEQ